MIKFVDMFSGIGGFREGLTRAGGFECVGHCEIDKYANRSYNALFDTKGEWFIEDARKADPSTMPLLPRRGRSLPILHSAMTRSPSRTALMPRPARWAATRPLPFRPTVRTITQ